MACGLINPRPRNRRQYRNGAEKLAAALALAFSPPNRGHCRILKAADQIGHHGSAAPDHVPASMSRAAPVGHRAAARSTDLYHDLSCFWLPGRVYEDRRFSTQVLILAQRQTVLVAKQAACLDVLSGGRFRLGIGVGWNEVEFVGLNENFHNRGRRSEEQVEVMKALWAEPHVNFKGKCHTIEDAGINPLPTRR